MTTETSYRVLLQLQSKTHFSEENNLHMESSLDDPGNQEALSQEEKRPGCWQTQQKQSLLEALPST